MAASQEHISHSTAMGANLVADGATFRVWVPGAEHVYVALGGISADGPPMHGLPHSAGVTIPANSVLAFALDWGD